MNTMNIRVCVHYVAKTCQININHKNKATKKNNCVIANHLITNTK